MEQALLHHMQALDELPAELIVHRRFVVSKRTGQAIRKQIAPARPTPALRKLMGDGG